MSSGKRYKNSKDEATKEDPVMEKKYKELLEELASKDADSSSNGSTEKESSDIQIKSQTDIKKTTEAILNKIEQEADFNKDEEKIKEIEATFENFSKGDVKSDSDSDLKLDIKEVDEVEINVLKEVKKDENASNEVIEVKENEEKEERTDKDKNNKKDKKKRKMPKALKIIGNIIYYIFFAFVTVILLLILVQRFSKNEVAIGGYRVFNVITESMVPEYEVGDVIISEEVEAKNIELGDDVVYLGKEAPFKDLTVTHRVVDLNENEDGSYSFITRGIANNVDDPIIEESQIYGRIIYKVYSLSYISKAINNTYLFFFVIFVPITILVSIKIIQVKSEKIFEEYDNN